MRSGEKLPAVLIQVHGAGTSTEMKGYSSTGPPSVKRGKKVMALTVSNANTLSLLNILNRTTTAQSNSLTRLATGFKVNKGSDNPAALIAIENLTAELTGVDEALNNNQRSNSVLNTADGALTELSSLLSQIESLVVQSVSPGALSNSEIAANQAQIDSAIEAIDQIVGTTAFNGKKLLDGTQAIDVTGVGAGTEENLKVFSRPQGGDVSITTKVITAATFADTSAFTIATADTLSQDTTILITGKLGSQTVDLASGDNAAAIIAAINTAKAATGVSAVDPGSGTNDNIRLSGTEFGSSSFVKLEFLTGGGFTAGGPSTDVAKTSGVDAVITVNGQTVTADGKDVSANANGVSLEFSLGANLDAVNDTDTFTVKSTGGLTFQLGVESNTRSTIGVNSLASYRLGGGDAVAFLSDVKSGGSADLSADSANTLSAVRKAISQVASARGRIGGFQKFRVDTSINTLNATKEALSSARSVLRDVDFAAETAELSRLQVLTQSGISLLAVAGQQSAQILSLLR
jgi:flagellin